MGLNYVAFAIPAFFLFVAMEYLGMKQKKKEHVFKYGSSISNLSIGIAERLLNLFISASFFQLFYWVYKNYALVQISTAWWVWIVLILATDFVWYWYHRLGHEVNFFWGAHIVHHQSEEFNYTVSARITTFQALVRNIFWCALPFIGFHPNMVITILVIHGGYSFLTHTQLLGRVKWLEYVLITPSLHGVHHASNEKYLDKNYGDVFVFWDKLFGTFQHEEEKPVYGLTHPIKSYSFLWQHFHYYLEIAEACKNAAGLKNKLRIIFGSPAVMDQSIRPILEQRYLQNRKNSSPAGTKLKRYLNIQLLVSVVFLTLLTLMFNETAVSEKLFALAFILVTLINCGALLDQRKYIYYLEYLRIFITLLWISYHMSVIEYLLYPMTTLLVLEYFLPLNKWYMQYVLQTHEDHIVHK